MKKILTLLLIVIACSYTTAYGQDNKKKATEKKEAEKKDSTLSDHYKQLGKDIKKTSEATWEEAKKASGGAWDETVKATGDVLEKVGEWSSKKAKEIKESSK